MTAPTTTAGSPQHRYSPGRRPAEPTDERLLRVLAKAPAWFASAAIHVVLVGIILQIGLFDGQDDTSKIYSVGLSNRNTESELDRGDDTLDSLVPVFDPIIDPASFRWDENQTETGEELEDFAVAADIPRLVALYGNYGIRSEGGRAQAVKRGGGTQGSERAVELALEWLQRHQAPADGGWHAHSYTDQCIRGAECKRPKGVLQGIDPGLTGLAALAFLGAGHTDQYGRFKPSVNKAMRYMLRLQGRDGHFGHKAGTAAIYNHSICTLAVSEAFGMTQNTRYRAAARNGIAYLLKAQHTDGGWGYVPATTGRYRSDVSVTGWAAMALKSADMAGIKVPAPTWKRMVGYIDAASDKGGLAGYTQAGHFNTPSNPSTIAVGLLCRQFAPLDVDAAKGKTITEALLRLLPREKGKGFFYHAYYGSLSLYQYGGPKWRIWNKHTRDLLVKLQQKQGCEAGSWDPGNRWWGSAAGRIYTTAMAALTLEVYYRYLPIHRGYVEETPATVALKRYRAGLESYRAYIKLADSPEAAPEKLLEALGHATASLEAYRKAAHGLKSEDEKAHKQRRTRLAATAIRLTALHLRSKDYARCIEEAEGFAARYPDYEDQETPKKLRAAALALLARKLDRDGEESKAAALRRAMVEDCYKRIIEDPDQPSSVYMQVAADFYSREDWWRGADILAELLNRFPDDPKVKKNSAAIRLRLGNCLLRSGRADQALKAFEALKNEAISTATLEGLAECYVQTRSFEKALQTYIELRRGCEVGGPQWWQAQYNIANTLMLLGRTEECGRLIGQQKALRPKMGGPQMRAKFESLLHTCGELSSEKGTKNIP